jgi:hypothetical protein
MDAVYCIYTSCFNHSQKSFGSTKISRSLQILFQDSKTQYGNSYSFIINRKYLDSLSYCFILFPLSFYIFSLLPGSLLNNLINTKICLHLFSLCVCHFLFLLFFFFFSSGGGWGRDDGFFFFDYYVDHPNSFCFCIL